MLDIVCSRPHISALHGDSTDSSKDEMTGAFKTHSHSVDKGTYRAPIAQLMAFSTDTKPEAPICGVAIGYFPPAFWRLGSAIAMYAVVLVAICRLFPRNT